MAIGEIPYKAASLIDWRLPMTALVYRDTSYDHFDNDGVFARIAADIRQQGYSIQPQALPLALAQALSQHLQELGDSAFRQAGIGRQQDFMRNQFVRTDEICWITGESTAGQHWLDWAARLQQFLNRQLLLGLFSFESHFAHYAPGDFYKRHLDAFRGEANRVLSLVVYLNPGWTPDNGGELVLYRDETDSDGIKVTPGMATVVAFLSEEFPHEVLPASRDRYSIAGWYRLNGSMDNRIDPPR